MLVIKHLALSYAPEKSVLEDVNLELEQGNIHGLVGLNGSGKTSLLNCLCGGIAYQQGHVHFNNNLLKKEDVIFLETNNYFYPNITGREYFRLFEALQPSFALADWNDLFELPLDEFIENYSTGMKKKLALMSVLSFSSPIMILDEPFNGVDMETVQLMKIIIGKLKASGRTILITSHILESLVSICDTISYLNNKQIQRTFNPQEYANIELELFDLTNKQNEERIDRLIKPE